MSRVRSTCSGWEVDLWSARLECFFRRKKSRKRRMRERRARPPRAMPIFAPVEREVFLLLAEELAVSVASAVEVGGAVTVEIEVDVAVGVG